MDLSAVIFVVLAVAWAVYLIPKALKHHDDLASDRLVEGHSDRVRILRRKTSPTPAGGVETVEVETETEVTTGGPATIGRSSRRKPELTVAGKAARRRRRVLALLLVSLATVSGLAYFAYAPWWSPAIPGGLVVVFLVIARFSVRKSSVRRAQRSSLAQRRPAEAPFAEDSELSMPQVEDQVDVALADLARGEDPDVAEVLADDGSLWDPLPMTLPTYVNKARARRTVRTIELTGMQSSGHDERDSELARSSAEATDEQGTSTEARRAAGA